jgi:hypothetical protein
MVQAAKKPEATSEKQKMTETEREYQLKKYGAEHEDIRYWVNACLQGEGEMRNTAIWILLGLLGRTVLSMKFLAEVFIPFMKEALTEWGSDAEKLNALLVLNTVMQTLETPGRALIYQRLKGELEEASKAKGELGTVALTALTQLRP